MAPVRSASKPLPWIEELRLLYEEGVTFRHGQLIVVAAQPGAGKSLFVQWMCNRWDVPTLYVSMDMSQSDTITRLGAMRCNMTHDNVKHAFEEDGPQSAWIEDELDKSVMDFYYDDAPTLNDIQDELSAYVEAYDAYPTVLVLDNLIDIDNEGDDEYRAWNQTLLWLKGLVRETGMTVIVVHHARELEKTDYPSARKDFAGKIAKTPELMLSVSMTPDNLFRIATVKNRGGKTDAMARRGIEMVINPAKVQFHARGRYEKPERGAA